MNNYPNLFKDRYDNLKGKNWLSTIITAEDRKAFSQLGFMHSDYGKLGGIARAKTGKRDNRGRFIGRNSGLIQ